MTPEQFRRVDEVFNALRGVAREERAEVLRRACPREPEVRAEVEALLAHDEEPRAYLRTPALDAGLQFITPATPAEHSEAPPERIGRYRILRRLGAGGFGVVYLAEQENPRRTVAVKVMSAQFASPQLLRRFEYEAQILGRLQHPGIARIYEAGTAPGPQGVLAFFAMEYVQGQPLDEFARARNLSLRARLELVARVCEAVQYAHQLGVIHRDLKPLNILVDEFGQPKVLDFGVARSTDADPQLTTMLTGTGQFVGTLPYMSPEQAGGDPRLVDTRSDVYALGVILYQLLSGQLPLDLRTCALPEAARRIRDEQPARLGSIARSLRGEVETIVGKAIEKDKNRRYQSALELANDLRRYLAGAPIDAKRDSTLYVLRKTLRRYRLVAGLLGGLAVLMIASSVTLALLYRRAVVAETTARAQRDAATAAEARAQQQTARSERIRKFLTDVLHAADVRALGRTATIADALDYAAERSQKEFSADPQTRADALQALSETFADLGQMDRAGQFAREAVQLYRALTPDGSLALGQALEHLGALEANSGRAAEALSLLGESVALQRRYDADVFGIARGMRNLAGAHRLVGDLERAAQIAREARALASAAGAQTVEQFGDLAQIHSLLAAIHFDGGQLDAAATEAERALEIFEQRMEALVHPDYAAAVHALAVTENARGNVERARELHYRALEVVRAQREPDHPDMANALIGVAQFERLHDNPAKSAELFEQALQIRRKFLPPGHPELGYPLSGLGAALLKLGRPAEAEPYLREAYELRIAAAPGQLTTGMTASDFGACLLELGRFAEAEPALRHAYEALLAHRGAQGRGTLEVARNLVRLYEATGAAEQAAEWSAKLTPETPR